MGVNLQDLTIILIGGDRREVELQRCWSQEGLQVKLAGFERFTKLTVSEQAAERDLRQAAVMITPLSGTREEGKVNAPFAEAPLSVLTYIEQAAEKPIFLTGSVTPGLRSVLQDRAQVIYTAEDEELALLNAIPTAEGAIQKAMELSDITLHGSRTLVLGLGRCGMVLVRSLQGLGCRVAVVVRRREAAALALTMGCEALSIKTLRDTVNQADFVFNTIPAPVLSAPVLENAGKHTLVLDLASSPGGTDFEAARNKGICAVHLPGLPGIVAPRSAGRILARVYRRMIVEKITGKQEQCWEAELC